jgi:hypothetical protein
VLIESSMDSTQRLRWTSIELYRTIGPISWREWDCFRYKCRGWARTRYEGEEALVTVCQIEDAPNRGRISCAWMGVLVIQL